MIEVLKQAVDWAEKHGEVVFAGGGMKAIEPMNDWVQAGRQAIAELESQEPYAWVAEDICEGQIIYGRPRKIWWECEKGVGKAFYTHPPQHTEQEPVKYEHKAYTMPPQPEQKTLADDFFKTIADKNPKPFPPSQRTWVGLTDEEAYEIYNLAQEKVNEHWENGGTTMMFPSTVYKAIEAKLKEKNT